MTLDPSAPGGMVTYRRTLTLSLFYKFYLTVLQKLRKQVTNLLNLKFGFCVFPEALYVLFDLFYTRV